MRWRGLGPTGILGPGDATAAAVVLVSSSIDFPFGRVLTAGTDVSVTDNGAGGSVEVASTGGGGGGGGLSQAQILGRMSLGV